MKAEKAESLVYHKRLVLVTFALVSWSGDIWSSFHTGRTSTMRTKGPELLRIHLHSSLISAAASFTWLHQASTLNLHLNSSLIHVSGGLLQTFLLLPCGAARSPERDWFKFGDAGSDVTLRQCPELKSNHRAKKKQKKKPNKKKKKRMTARKKTN